MQIEVGGLAEVEAKVARVRAWLARSGVAGVLLGRQDNFAWLSGGRDNHVVAASEAGFGWLLVTATGRFALADRIEAGRLREEEIGAQGWEWQVYEWYRDGALTAAVRDVVGDAPVVADLPVAGLRPLDATFDALRADLVPAEIQRYHLAARHATEAMVETCALLRVGQREHEIAADLTARVRARGARACVVLIATDERILRYRHPIPTDKPLREEAMVVLGASTFGLQRARRDLARLRRRPRAIAHPGGP